MAQTTTLVYGEDFNSGQAGWTIGGFHPSWSYGIPSLPNILSNGTNCFTTGDAGATAVEPFSGCLPVTGPTTTGNYYNCCERSFVESPIIDLTGVQSPLLSVDINLHCEQTFDGAKAQISINGGTSWQDIGAYTSSTFLVFPHSSDCREQNWYNKNNISYLSGTAGGCGMVNFNFGGGNSGWSGGCALASSGACTTIDNHGTNGWITAKLCIPQTANKASVKIRFDFGSGSQVYSDGFAFDNVQIWDVYPVVNFSGNQTPACNPTYAFTNNTDCGATWLWNFGHPTSPGNTSTDPNPIHQFPTSGNFNVTLTATDFCGGNASFNLPVTLVAANGPVISGITPVATLVCDSASGSASIALSSPGSPPYSITYIHNNVADTVSGLTGNPLLLTGLNAGNYSSLSIIDGNGCTNTFSSTFVVPYSDDNLIVNATGDTSLVPGETAILGVTANIPSTFIWSPANTLNDPFSTNPIAAPIITTEYTVIATDSNGCAASSQVTVFINDERPCEYYFFPNSFTPNGDGKNEVFQFYSDPTVKLLKFNLKIYDRWGKVAFQTIDPLFAWNGKSMVEGIYMVVADFECGNKKTSRYSGTLLLIR